jgi:hypothetical protein
MHRKVTSPPSVVEYVRHCRTWLRMAVMGELGVFLKKLPLEKASKWSEFNWTEPSIEELQQLAAVSPNGVVEWAKEVVAKGKSDTDPKLRGLKMITSTHFAYPIIMAACKYDL